MPEETSISEPAATDKSKRSRPVRVLPTERIAYQKQLDILRAYAISAEANNRAVSSAEVAGIVNMAVTTVPHANSFFVDVGLLQKTEGGYLPNQDVVNFNRAFAWNAETAPHKLAPTLQSTWFAQAILPKLAFRAMDEAEAVAILAETSGATPEFKGPLSLLLNYLESANLVSREGGQVRAVRTAATTPALSTAPSPEHQPTKGVETKFARPSTGDGVHFNLAINIDMKEMGTWGPERITAFFAGFAQVLAAKGALEQTAAKE
jgi:hypothetical protein